MAITVLATNVGVPTPITTAIVNDQSSDAVVLQLEDVVCATTKNGILVGDQATVTIHGTLVAGVGAINARAIDAGSFSSIVVSDTGTVIGGSTGIFGDFGSTIKIAGHVRASDNTIMAGPGSQVIVAGGGSV
jgi:hypothetical protein